MESPDYILNIHGLSTPQSRDADEALTTTRLQGRPWLAIHWKCCSVYSRVYRNRHATAYDGRCPKCSKSLHVPIGEGGTSNRFFEAE